MIDVMTRLKIHNMAEGGTPQASIAALCGTSLRSVERILAEAAPRRDEVLADGRVGAKRQGRPPKADEAMVERIRLLLAAPGNDRLREPPPSPVLSIRCRWSLGGLT